MRSIMFRGSIRIGVLGPLPNIPPAVSALISHANRNSRIPLFEAVCERAQIPVISDSRAHLQSARARGVSHSFRRNHLPEAFFSMKVGVRFLPSIQPSAIS